MGQNWATEDFRKKFLFYEVEDCLFGVRTRKGPGKQKEVAEAPPFVAVKLITAAGNRVVFPHFHGGSPWITPPSRCSHYIISRHSWQEKRAEGPGR